MKDGRLEMAEQTASRAVEIGLAAGQPDAFTWYAGQLFAVRECQDRLAELVELIATETVNNPGLPAWRVIYGYALAGLGRLDEARPVLDEFVADDFAAVPKDVLWIACIGNLVTIAVRVGATEYADLLYETLLPYRTQSVHAGVTYLGSAEHYLGELSRLAGRLDLADEHFAAADAAHVVVEAPVWRARSQVRWASLLLERDAPGDREKATAMLDAASAQAREGDWPLVARLAAEVRAAAG
jgi:hypothetical protein